MEKYTERTEKFIYDYVLTKLGYDSINEENISEIVDYIIDNYEVPLAQAKEAGESIDDDLLNTATAVVTEITSRHDW
ncbi:MAG: hypothetical protein ACI35W_07690 [Anaeroplasmataceae bacterium]